MNADKFLSGYPLPADSGERKDVPLHRGLLRYFPSALALVAKISKHGNDKHNAGEPIHHARGKSADHSDCIVRHLVDLDVDNGRGVGYDEDGVPQVGYIAWRALALAQEWLEQNEGAPMAPGASAGSVQEVERTMTTEKQEASRLQIFVKCLALTALVPFFAAFAAAAVVVGTIKAIWKMWSD